MEDKLKKLNNKIAEEIVKELKYNELFIYNDRYSKF